LVEKFPTVLEKLPQVPRGDFLTHTVYEFVCVLYQADSRSSLIKVHFDQLSTSDFWCCLCSRILRQPQGSTSNLCKHLQARHPKEFSGIAQIMSKDSLVKVEGGSGMVLFNDLSFCVCDQLTLFLLINPFAATNPAEFPLR